MKVLDRLINMFRKKQQEEQAPSVIKKIELTQSEINTLHYYNAMMTNRKRRNRIRRKMRRATKQSQR